MKQYQLKSMIGIRRNKIEVCLGRLGRGKRFHLCPHLFAQQRAQLRLFGGEEFVDDLQLLLNFQQAHRRERAAPAVIIENLLHLSSKTVQTSHRTSSG